MLYSLAERGLNMEKNIDNTATQDNKPAEEKIDDRKWMPELFNILQKWEQTPVNEKLIINNE